MRCNIIALQRVEDLLPLPPSRWPIQLSEGCRGRAWRRAKVLKQRPKMLLPNTLRTVELRESALVGELPCKPGHEPGGHPRGGGGGTDT